MNQGRKNKDPANIYKERKVVRNLSFSDLACSIFRLLPRNIGNIMNRPNLSLEI